MGKKEGIPSETQPVVPTSEMLVYVEVPLLAKLLLHLRPYPLHPLVSFFGPSLESVPDRVVRALAVELAKREELEVSAVAYEDESLELEVILAGDRFRSR